MNFLHCDLGFRLYGVLLIFLRGFIYFLFILNAPGHPSSCFFLVFELGGTSTSGRHLALSLANFDSIPPMVP